MEQVHTPARNRSTTSTDLKYWTGRRTLLIERMLRDAARPLHLKPLARQVAQARIDALRMLDSLIAELSK